MASRKASQRRPTWAQTMVRASHWVGLTLPGMMLLPGSFSGSLSSPRPHLRPAAQEADVVAYLRARIALNHVRHVPKQASKWLPEKQ